jgi:hypothetical protein
MKRRQQGSTVVEFAIIGALLMATLLGTLEFGRALYTVNMLTEATRRGARMAAVCPVGDPKPASVAVFDDGHGASMFLSGLTPANILVEYLDASGATIANPADNFEAIGYVRVSITGYSLSLFIPAAITPVPMSGFSTTLPRESLGIPRAGVVTPC